jgi:ABC-type sulfate/molybdate transport systems ATPase subunit
MSEALRSHHTLNEVSFEVKRNSLCFSARPAQERYHTAGDCRAHQAGRWEHHFDRESVDALPPTDRDIAFVFQQYSLYPMTVYDNLAFPLRSPLRNLREPEIKKRVTEAAEVLRIGHLLERKTAKLSGGEMQRVSIGRAIVRHPRVYLMDEPLSNLDAKLREALRVELSHLQRTQGSTTLFVTHDQIEALTMADRIGVLNHGRIVQIGTPEDIYDRPATTFVAQLVGTPKINLLNAATENGTLSLQESDVRLPSSDVTIGNLPRSSSWASARTSVRTGPACLQAGAWSSRWALRLCCISRSASSRSSRPCRAFRLGSGDTVRLVSCDVTFFGRVTGLRFTA